MVARSGENLVNQNVRRTFIANGPIGWEYDSECALAITRHSVRARSIGDLTSTHKRVFYGHFHYGSFFDRAFSLERA